MNNPNSECDVIISETEKKSTPNVWIGIYGLRNKEKLDKWYIGCSSNIAKRWVTAYQHMNCKKQKKIYHALVKYGYDGFEKIILEECPKELFKERETYWINHHNSISKGYNIASGGQGGATRQGMIHSETTKAKIRNSKLGKSLSDEHRNNIRMGVKKKGNKITTEHRLKMLAGRYRPTIEEKRETARLYRQRVRLAVKPS